MIRTRRVYSGFTLLRILYPVGLCMLITAMSVDLSKRLRNEASTVVYGLFRSYDTHDDGWFALLFFTFLIITTTLGVTCYRLKYYELIRVYMVANSIALLIVYAFFHFRNVALSRSIPVSLPTAVFLVLNFGVFGVLALHWKCSQRFNQFYLILLAAFTAVFLINNMPDWTVWIALMALCVWDIIAVLTPCGPLKMLIKTANRRGEDNFPAMVYISSSMPGTPENSTPDTARSDNTEMTDLSTAQNLLTEHSDSLTATPLTPRRTREIREVEGTIRLGMGDFVFYSVMLGNVVQTATLPTTVACFVSNLVGLIITLPIVTLSQTALPALPFPLAIAAIFYFSSHIALNPFTDLCTTRLVLF